MSGVKDSVFFMGLCFLKPEILSFVVQSKVHNPKIIRLLPHKKMTSSKAPQLESWNQNTEMLPKQLQIIFLEIN